MVTKRKKSLKWTIGVTVIVGCVAALSLLNISENLVYFYTPSEAVAKAAELSDRTIKVGGMVKTGTVNWESRELRLNFVMTDYQGHDIAVFHQGPPPDLFKEGQGVVVEGRIDDGGRNMVSRNLMVKHSEEYKKPEEGVSMDRELLEKSLFKN